MLRSSTVDQVTRRISPLGYNLVAATWNAHPSVTHQFAVLRATSPSNDQHEIVAAGQPITMREFLVSSEDCGVAPTNTVDAELQALTRHIAMGVVYGRQRRDTAQQHRQDRRTSAFGPSNSENRNVRRRYNPIEDSHGSPDHPSSPSDFSSIVVGTDFSELNQIIPDTHVELDEDAPMLEAETFSGIATRSVSIPAPVDATRSVSIPAPVAVTDDVLDVLALAHANAFQELPQLPSETDPSDPIDIIDFSVFGNAPVAEHPSA